MRQAASTLAIRSTGRGLVDVTREVAGFATAQKMQTGLLTVFCRHTSASLIINENADPDVQRDLEAFLDRLVPEDARLYAHASEGPDDMPAHIRAMLTQTSLSIPLIGGRLALGAWQGVYLFEHRRAAHTRELALHLVGA